MRKIGGSLLGKNSHHSEVGFSWSLFSPSTEHLVLLFMFQYQSWKTALLHSLSAVQQAVQHAERSQLHSCVQSRGTWARSKQCSQTAQQQGVSLSTSRNAAKLGFGSGYSLCFADNRSKHKTWPLISVKHVKICVWVFYLKIIFIVKVW